MTTPAADARQETPAGPEVASGTEATGDRCPTCPHPLDSHDAIARRYCAATAAGQSDDRGCVCGASSKY